MQKILIVEDEPSIASMYEFKLKLEGYNAAVELSGEAGLITAKQFKPDLLLLDLKMPGMSGDELLSKIRATDWGSSIRVIIMTNVSRDEAPSSLRFLHVDRYVVKAHHTPGQIAAIVAEVLVNKTPSEKL